MDLSEAMRTSGACRAYRPDPVPDAVFYDAIDDARFGPQGGNRQPVRFVIVRDPARRRALGELYLGEWRDYLGPTPVPPSATEAQRRSVAAAEHFAEHFGEHPTVVVVCADLARVHPTDVDLGRLSIVGGASVYPIVQNLCLALRARGVATTLTTLLCRVEPAVREIIGLPATWSTACHIVAGYPEAPFPTRLRRAPVEKLAFVDGWGAALGRS